MVSLPNVRPDPKLVGLARGDVVELSSLEAETIIEQAVEHRVLATIRTGLAEERIHADPESLTTLRSTLAAHELRGEARLTSFAASARESVALLRAAELQVMVMKGWWSMHVLYERCTDRVTSDVDLFLAPGDAGRRDDLEAVLGPSRARRWAGSGHPDAPSAWTFDETGVAVDVNTNPFTLPVALAPGVVETIWSEFTEVGDERWANARVPSLELALAQALVNYCKDRYMRLFQVVEVGLLVSHPDLDWRRFHDLVVLAGIRRITDASLHAVTSVLDLPCPPGAGRPSPLVAPWTADRMILTGRRSRFSFARRVALQSLAFGHWAGSGRELLGWATPSPGELAYHLAIAGADTGGGYGQGLTRLQRHRFTKLTRRLRGLEDLSVDAGPPPR